MTHTAVFGIFTTRPQAERCADILQQDGFTADHVSILMSQPDSTRELATEKHTKTPEGVATGATTGGVIGGTLGLLAGIGTLAVPGIGPLIAAGPLMATLAGFGAGAAAGGVVGALIGMGIPEYEAKRYEGRVKSGGILLSVHCDDGDMDQYNKAKELLKRSGAEDISSTGEAPVSQDARLAS